MLRYYFCNWHHYGKKPYFLPSFSKLFSEFLFWTFLKCPKSISLLDFWKIVVTEKWKLNIQHIFVTFYGFNPEIIIVTMIFERSKIIYCIRYLKRFKYEKYNIFHRQPLLAKMS